MLTSPITITIDGVAHSLPRINNDNFSSTYLKKAALLEVRLEIRNSYESKTAAGQVERHIADLTVTTWDADGVATVTQSYQHIRAKRGADPVTAVNVAKALDAFVTANAAALVAWES